MKRTPENLLILKQFFDEPKGVLVTATELPNLQPYIPSGIKNFFETDFLLREPR